MKIDPRNTLVVACSMLRAEVESAMEQVGISLPVQWVRESLHERPELLRTELQKIVGQNDAYQWILLAFNWCGGALEHLRSDTAVIVVPRFHDCIRMLQPGKAATEAMRTDSLYFTWGWVESDGFLSRECARFARKHGEERAHKVYRRMLREYHAITLLDTGVHYPGEPEDLAEVKRFAECMGLAVNRQPGSTHVLEKLFSGDFDDDFVLLPPNTLCSIEYFL